MSFCRENRHAPKPVIFSCGVWKYRLVVHVAKYAREMTIKVTVTARRWYPDHLLFEFRPMARSQLNEKLSCSARKRMVIVRRKRWPETSCPRLSRGTCAQPSVGGANEAVKRFGCVAGDTVDFVKQNSEGTDTRSPDGRCNTHSPPVDTFTRSKRDGPKNQPVKSTHTNDAVRYLYSRSLYCTLAGLVK